MTKRDYTQEFKEQILRECQEVGNVSVVARRHNISPNTIHTWRSKARKTGSTKPLGSQHFSGHSLSDTN